MTGFRGIEQAGDRARVFFRTQATQDVFGHWHGTGYADLSIDDVQGMVEQLGGFLDAWHASEQNSLSESEPHPSDTEPALR